MNTLLTIFFLLVGALAVHWDHFLQLIPLALLYVASLFFVASKNRETWQARDNAIVYAFIACVLFVFAVFAEFIVLWFA
jgi:hypothetical protein